MKGSAPEKKTTAQPGTANRRWWWWLLVAAGITLGAFAGGLAFVLWPRTHAFYTDADTINQPAATARVRDILWQPPITLPDLIVSEADEYEPKLSTDGMTLFFVRGKAGDNADIYYCDHTPHGWSDPEPLTEVNTEYDELGPEPSSDGQSLYFYSDRPGGMGGYDLWSVHRPRDGRSGYGEAMNLGALVNSEFNDYGPAVTRDGKTLYFASNRRQSTDADLPSPDAWPGTIREDLYKRTYDLHISTITEQGVGKALPIQVLNTPHNEGAPAVSPFEDFLYFASDRPGGEGAFDLYRSRLLRGGHEPPSNLGSAVNTPANELDPGLTTGGYALYFSSDRPIERLNPDKPNPYQVYQTTSREVFTETETHRASIDWPAIWSMIGAHLLWALLALLLLLFFLTLLRDLKGRKLSLLARCLLASLAVHMLLMLLFNVWEVTVTLARELGGRGPIQIALVAPARGDDLAAQIRGEFTSVKAPALPEYTVEQKPTRIEWESRASMATLEVDRDRIEIHHQFEVNQTVADARPARGPDVPPMEPHLPESANREPLDLALPTENERIREAENTSSHPSIPAETLAVDHGSISLDAADTMRPVPPVTLPPQSAGSATSSAPQQSLAEPAPRYHAATPILVRLPPSDTQASLERPAALDLPLPKTRANRTAAHETTESTSPPLPRVVDSPRRILIAEAIMGTPSQDMRHLEPAAAAPIRYESSLAQTGQANAIDAKLAPAALPPADAGDTALAGLPFAALSLSRFEEPASSTRDEASARPMHVLLEGRPRSLDRPPGADPIQVEPSFELAPIGDRTSLVDQTGFFDSPDHRSDTRVSTLSLPEPSLLPKDIPVPGPSTLKLPLPSETMPPDNPYARRARDQRAQVAEGLGGSAETEDAVRLALEWLAAHQSPDGRWSGDDFDENCGECGGETHIEVDVAITGLSLLCFLAADHTHDKQGPYQDNVKRALQWLTTGQQRNGDLRRSETMYSHGIATIALAEGHGMTGDPRLQEPVQRAARFIEHARNRRIGGWRYDPGQPGDTSVLGWQIMALKSAKAAGVNVPMEPFLAARNWLDLVSAPSAPGLYAYQPGTEATPAMTAEGLFIQQILGRGPNEPRMRQSIDYLLDYLPDWEGDLNTYYWYYATLALFHHQGSPWTRWNEALTEELLGHQRRSGPPAGSWDPEGKWAKIGGRVYQTAMCTLMLEVYYRYLPLFLSDIPSEAIGTIEGSVTEASSENPIPGATVRLDLPDRPPVEVTAGTDGTYRLLPPPVPTFFALSASSDGYLPMSHNVASALVKGSTLTLDFELVRETQSVIVIEAVPQVHHLGDDSFDGRINSQFQKRAEGSRFTAHFTLMPGQSRLHNEPAEVTMLVKGVQLESRIRINGRALAQLLDWSPSDGSFGEFTAPFDTAILQTGTNTIEIIADRRGSDVDDFEFVNVQIRLVP